MLLSIALILLLGMLAGKISKILKFPSLFGMILVGMLIGPFALDLLDVNILSISAEIRKIALIIILLRAGITLNLADLRKVGRPAVLMCFLPACFEMIGMVVLAPLFLSVSRLDAAVMGAVVGAVSPAVIVPRMIELIEKGYGTKKSIPQLVLAGASVDDVFVIVMFTAFTSMAQGEKVSALSFVNIPVSIVLGIVVGFVVGLIVCKLFAKVKMQDTIKVAILLGLSFVLVTAEDKMTTVITFSALLAVMFVGVAIKIKNETISKTLSGKLNQMWMVAEIFLFVLVGASVNTSSALDYGVKAILLVLCVLVFRMFGVLCCLIRTPLTLKERLFCVISYIPKATVQAAIGGLPLAMGLGCGEVVLTVSVLAILITAPLGAFGIDLSYKRLLQR